MSFSKTPLDFGSWSEPVLIFDPKKHFDDETKEGEKTKSIDAHFNGVIAEDGSFVGLWRTCNCIGDLVEPWRTRFSGVDPSTCFSVPHAIQSSAWKNPAGYA